MSVAIVSDFKPGMRVRYIPGHARNPAGQTWIDRSGCTHPDCEDGTVSSLGETCVRVRFDKQVQACDPSDLIIWPPSNASESDKGDLS